MSRKRRSLSLVPASLLLALAACAKEPDDLVSPSPVETSAILSPSVGSQVPSPPTTRPSPFTVKPATLATKPLEYSKPGLTITEVAMLVSSLPSSVKLAGGDPPSVWPGVNACPTVEPAASCVNTSTATSRAKSDST